MQTKAFKSFLKNDWVIALGLLGVYLLTIGYIYGWHDQHLEIPLLKSLIDPTLYVGDYYVEGLKKNFFSFLYLILARLITVDQIPAAYLMLYVIARYFLFFWMYKLWLFICKDRFLAVLSVLAVTLLIRVEAFLYRDFSHQEFSYIFMMAGLYFFYRERYLLCAAILGFGANFHFLYCGFPTFYLLFYLFVYQREIRIDKCFKAMGTFMLFALPVFIWMIRKALSAATFHDEGWLNLYLAANSGSFIIPPIKSFATITEHWPAFFAGTESFGALAVFTAINWAYNPFFKTDKKVKVIVLAAALLWLVHFIFTSLFPHRLFLDLNLVRNAQFIHFFLIGYTVLLISQLFERKNIWLGSMVLCLFLLVRFETFFSFLSAVLIFGLLKIHELRASRSPKMIICFWVAVALLSLLGIAKGFSGQEFSISSIISLVASVVLVFSVTAFIQFNKTIRNQNVLLKTLMTIPYLIIFLHVVFFHYLNCQALKSGDGFWQLRRNWIDMQKFVRINVAKDALIMVPQGIPMGGFRIFSERKILVSDEDHGIIGFDYLAAQETFKRIDDVGAFQMAPKDMNEFQEAIKKAINFYKVDYIVFARYLQPPSQITGFQKIYQNEVFALFKVEKGPYH